MKTSFLLLAGLSALALTACETSMTREIQENGRYWQRIDTTDAIYQQGPKAQQILFQDIARCTAELNEMEHLMPIRNTVPAEAFDQNGNKIDPNSPDGRLANWDTPERNGYLRAEHMDYRDFEGCMTAKGWERVEYMNAQTQTRARDTYLENIGYQKYRTKTNERKDDFKNLNQ
jgi:hypothetical protein